MRFLIVEDEEMGQIILKEYLSAYGDCDIANNGEEAIQAFKLALENKTPYDLICMDIMMPKLDGQQALQRIRQIEKDLGIKNTDYVKVIMTTALGDQKNVIEAFYKGGATSYIVKPIKKQKLLIEMQNLGINV